MSDPKATAVGKARGVGTPVLSVIIPSYGAARTVLRSVDELIPVLDRTIGDAWEIIVVDDGGKDFGPNPWHPHPGVRLLRFETNHGKGAAVTAGMLSAKGESRIYTDADLPYGPLLIPVMARSLLSGRCHVALGDRTLPGSTYSEDVGLVRRAVSALCSKFVGTLVTGGFFDTQCGLKGFRGDAASHLFSLVQIERFSFDVEILYLALRFNCTIRRFPVQLRECDDPSTVRLVRDSARAVVDILKIKLHAMRGLYDDEALSGLIRDEVAEEIAEARAEVEAMTDARAELEAIAESPPERERAGPDPTARQ